MNWLRAAYHQQSRKLRWSDQLIQKEKNRQQGRILWARNMLIDVDLFAKTETGILHQLTKIGYEIFFISGHSRQKCEFKNQKIHLFSIPLGKDFPLKYHLLFSFVQLFSFPFYLIKVRPNYMIIDWDSIYSVMPALLLCRLLKTKIILDIRSTPTPVKNVQQKAGYLMRLQSLAFNISVNIAKKRLDGMTIITDLMKKEVCSKFHVDPKWVGVWSSGVSSELFSCERYARSGMELREKLGLSGKFVVLYHGGFSLARGLMDTIGAMSLVRDRYPDSVLFLLGAGSTETIGEMKKAVMDSGLRERVVLHEAVDHRDVPKYIAMSDVGIVPLLDLPQWRNQCPTKLLEYLAMEKVVILSDIPCHREIIGDNKFGIFMPSISPTGIASSIAYAHDNRDKLKDWGASGRVTVTNKYTWEKIARNLEDYLRRIENKSGRNSRVSD
jgi:glycosyltransferase involved in cell wall biosynthesis